MTSQNHTLTYVAPHVIILDNLKKFLRNFDDLKEKLILKINGELDSLDMGREGGMQNLSKIIERVYNSHRYITQQVLRNNEVTMGTIDYVKVE